MTSIKHLKHQDIDFEKWNKTILSSAYPFVSAQSFYLDATCPNWSALVIGDYESVFPITAKQKMGFTYLPQPPFTSQLGAFGKVNPEVENLFLDYIISHYKLIDLELNTAHQFKSKYITPKVTYYIDYATDFIFNQNTKRNIAKAKKLGLQIVQVSSNDVLPLSQKYITPFLQKEVGLSLSTISALDRLITNAIQHQQLVCFKTIDSKCGLKAIAYFICNGKHAFYLKGNNIDKADNSGSMHLLMEHAIHYFSDKALWFDFGGGAIDGIANFYKGFGAKVMTYSFLQINTLPRFINLLKNKKATK